MICPEKKYQRDADYFSMLRLKLEERRIPVTGDISLTGRCNLRCVHCYLGSVYQRPQARAAELGTDKWLSIIDEIVEAGCLYLLITGGEPLLRSDFATIYSHAKKSGLIVTVFTNGSLVTRDVIALFKDLPPADVEISLYGATEETYKTITGVSGAFERCLQGIDRLYRSGLPFSLKTVLMSENCDELDGIKAIADSYGVDFRFDGAIFPRLDGDALPLQHRVDPARVVELEFKDPGLLTKWQDYLAGQGDLRPFEKLYNCGAGSTYFHIDAFGRLQPCVLSTTVTFNLLTGPFKTGWTEVISKIRETGIDNTMECSHCEKRQVCGLCPAFFGLESGSEQVKSDYLCVMGHHRHNAIFNNETKGNVHDG